MVEDQPTQNKLTVQVPDNLYEAMSQHTANVSLLGKEFTQKAIQSFLDGMMHKSDVPVTNYIQELGMKQLQKHILQQLEKSQPYTSGTEGDTYRLKINGKDYIIVKKRYHISEKEHIFQEKAYKIARELSAETGNIVAVPELFSHFIDDSSEYIVMEYIQGKTLYALILEQLVTKILLPLLEKSGRKMLDYSHDVRLQEFLTNYAFDIKQGDLDFNGTTSSSFYSRFEQSSRIHFSNDTNAEVGTLELYNLLYDTGLIRENPNQTAIGSGLNPFLAREYKKYFSQFGLFQEGESVEVRKNLRIFLQKLHENKLYHRDIGGNPRNIMFGENGKIYIIDFGKGTETLFSSSSSEEIYHNQIHNGRYDNDMEILDLISNLTQPSEQLETEKQREKLKNLEDTLPMEQIYKVAEKLDISNKSIKSACHLGSGASVKGIVAGLDRLLVKNNRIFADEFIYYPKILLARRITPSMQPERIKSTYKGLAKLLVNLFILSQEDLVELRELLTLKLEENKGKGTRLSYISTYIYLVQEVLDSK
ncbi:hypothetical protein AUK10_01970 [Candidatus Gracilibacteria bacterium CG2_30_37_12]|nr:MAG: hypothetical protein AUK10_01970 [Candidatus Gracilibacteria bacterium CG2_30_37_12]